ncbi:WD40 repeat-containing protein [Tieghemostelium lacteum]|uniref:WD40 repeat-containing protein n=1 Tax=Tieghemostelium lacteum TaxID=361077 RepID=A0A152A4Q6_TIELA|nr:WD40 repeat-containing protein [Tieghemostelium lacteum]|eukprot:KYR01213.1 WD40 repeat-containing protein [Tieghemostelium lacteum]
MPNQTAVKYGSYHRLVDYFIVCGLNKSIVVNQISKPYQSEVLERFPSHNHEDAPLPPHIWMFCFPVGLYLKQQAVEPTISMFCLTEFDGARFYTTSLVYYQPIPSSHIEGGYKQLYSPVSINLLSRYPCYGVLKQLLKYIYLYSMTGRKENILPLERILSNIVDDLPRPLAGYRMNIQLPPLDYNVLSSKLGLVGLTESPIEGVDEAGGIHYQACNIPTFPETEVPFHLLFYLMGIQNVLKIFSCILHERKVLFLSKNPSLLTISCETISSLLFPFVWPHVYIPILPELLGDFLQAPTPFIVGMILNHSNSQATNHFLNVDSYPDIIVVNLDKQIIHFPQQVQSIQIAEIEPVLIEERLKQILFPDLVSMTLAFPQLQSNTNVDRQLLIKSVFLSFFVSYFNDLDEFLYLIRKYPKPITTFNKSNFLMKHQNPDVVTFLTDIIETSAISTFFDENYFKNDSFFYLICKYYKQEKQKHQDQDNYTCFDSILSYMDIINKKKLEMELKIITIPKPDEIDIPPQQLDNNNNNNNDNNNNTSTIPCKSTELNENLFSKRIEFSRSLLDLSPIPLDIYSFSKLLFDNQNQSKEEEEIPNTNNGNNNNLESNSNNIESNNSNVNNFSNDIDKIKRSSIFISTNDIGELVTNSTFVGQMEGDQGLLKEFIEKSVEMIFLDVTTQIMDTEQQRLFIDLLTLKNARVYLIASLEFLREKKAFTIKNNWKFHLFLEMSKKVFLECDKSAEFQTSSDLLARCKDLYIEPGHDHIYNHFAHQKLWKNIHFWESCFYQSLVEMRKDRLQSTFNDYRENDWDSITVQQQKEAVEIEEEIIFQSLSSYCNLMIRIKMSILEVSRFLGRMSILANLSDEHQQTLEKLADKIHQAIVESTVPLTVPVTNTPSKKHQRTPSHQRHNSLDFDVSSSQSPFSEDSSLSGHLSGEFKLNNSMNANSSNNSNSPSIGNSEESTPLTSPSNSNLDIKYFTTSVKRNIEVEKDVSKQYYQKLIEIKRKKSTISTNATLKKSTIVNTSSNSLNLSTTSSQSTNQGSDIQSSGDSVGLSSSMSGSGSSLNSLNVQAEITSERKDGYSVTTLKGSGSGVSCVAIHNKPNVVLNGTTMGQILVWNYEDGKFQQRLTNHKSQVTCLGIGQYDVFSSGSRDKTLRIYNYDGSQWQCTSTLQEHTAEISCLDMKRNTILTGSYDFSMIMWDVRTNRKVRKFTGHTGNVLSTMLLQHGDLAITTSSDTTARVWDLRTMKTLHVLSEHNDWVMKAVMGEGNTLFTGGFDCLIKVWDISSGKSLNTLSSHAGGINALAYNHKSKILISGSGDGFLKAWDVHTGYSIKSFKGHKDEILSILYEGDTLITSSQDQTIRVWDINTGVCQKVLRGHSDWVCSLASPKIDSPLNKFVSASWDSTVKIWDISNINSQIELKSSIGSGYFKNAHPNVLSNSNGSISNNNNPTNNNNNNNSTSPNNLSPTSISPQKDLGANLPSSSSSSLASSVISTPTLSPQILKDNLSSSLSSSLISSSYLPTFPSSPTNTLSPSTSNSSLNLNSSSNNSNSSSLNISKRIVDKPTPISIAYNSPNSPSGSSSSSSSIGTPSLSSSLSSISSSTSSSSSNWQFGSPSNRNERKSSEKLISSSTVSPSSSSLSLARDNNNNINNSNINNNSNNNNNNNNQ